MGKLVARTVVAVTLAFLVFHFFFAWINSIEDSTFHWAFGEYVRTGSYPLFSSFWYPNPTTEEPPLYSLFLLILQSVSSRADILLHAAQLLMLTATAFLVYTLTAPFIDKSAAMIVACLFALIPGNVLFVSYIMTETGAQLGLTIYAYLVYRYVKTKTINFIAVAALLGCLLGLYRYSFIVFGAAALAVFLIARGKHRVDFLLPALGVSIVIGWVFVNHAITGVWGLSDAKDIHLWNQAVWMGKLLPSEETAPMKKLRQYVPFGTDLNQAYWVTEFYILPYVGRDWVKTVDIMGPVAIAAIREHPLAYLKNTVYIFVNMLQAGRPYWDNLSRFGNDNPARPLPCNWLGKFKLCSPLIRTPVSFSVWNAYVRTSDWFYEHIFPLWSVWMFLPSLVVLLVFGDTPRRSLALLYLVGTIPIAAYEHPDARYVIPFYPLMVIITCAAYFTITLWFKKKTSYKGESV